MINAVSKSCFKMLCTLLNDEFAKYVYDNRNCGGFHDNYKAIFSWENNMF